MPGTRQVVRVGNRVVGSYDIQSRVFRKTVKRSKHFLWKFKAWGIDATVFDALVKKGCLRIDIRETEAGDVFSAPLELWERESRRENLGHGLQVFLREAIMPERIIAGDDGQPTLW